MALNITFVVNYYDRDAALVADCVAALNHFYPAATVLQIEDNPPLKTPDKAGQWTERWMTQAAATSPDIIIKVDPDTRALRAVTSFPTTDIFGQLAPEGTYFPGSSGIISGGCIGFKASAVTAILNSGLLRDMRYSAKPFACVERRFGLPQSWIVLNDPIVHDVAQRLSLTEGIWDGLSLKHSWDADKTHPADATFIHPAD